MDPGLFFDMVADGEGLRTRRGTGVFNIRGSNDRLDISQRVVNTWNSLPDSLKGVGGSAGLQEPREGQWREDRDPERVPLRDAHGCDHWDHVQDYNLGEGNVKVVAQSEHVNKVLKEVVTLEENDLKDENYELLTS